MGKISYYSWGSYYYDNSTSYYTYYKVSNISTSLSTSIPYNGSTTLYVKPIIDGYNGKAARINIKTSSSALKVNNNTNYTAVISPSAQVNSTFAFTLKNNNTSYSNKYTTVSITAYTEKNQYKTVTRSVNCIGNPNMPVDNSYFTYYSSYYTYYNSNNKFIYTYYYSINSLNATFSKQGALAYYENVKLIPSVALSHPAAKIDKVEYRVQYPYYLSLSNSGLLVAGKTSNLGAVTLYAYNTTKTSESARVNITAYCGRTTKTIQKSIIVNPKPQPAKPQILSHTLTGNANIPFNGSTTVNAKLQLSNDYVVSNVSYISTSASFAYYLPSSISSSSLKKWGNTLSQITLGTLKTRPEILHSGTTLRVVNTIKTSYGLTSTRYMDVTISATDMAYYNSYYAPRIESASISRSNSNIAYDGEASFTLYYSIKNDSVASITWSTSSLHASLSSSGNKATLFANNQTTLNQVATVSAKLVTKSGLTRIVNSSVVIGAAPVVEPEEPEKPDTPKLTLDEARANIIAYVNAQFDLLNV
jgi:hypothetical protein